MEKGKNVIIAGSRTFQDYGLLKEVLDIYLEQNMIERSRVTIYCGDAKGADHLGIRYANENHIDLAIRKPDWARYGHGAGLVRNEAMVEFVLDDDCFQNDDKQYDCSGVLFAFWDGKSHGTRHIIDYAEKRGLEAHVIRYEA